MILSAVFANRIARRITGPINAIDLDDPDEDAVYEELAPLLLKIRYKSSTRIIFRYMKTLP